MKAPFSEATLDDYITRPRQCALAASRNMRGDVLVLGAAGKMGLHLCRMLQRCFKRNRRGNRVIAVSRFSAPGSRAAFERYGIDAIACDLENEASLEALPDAGFVFFLAGVKFGTHEHPDVLHRLNVVMPGKVARRFNNAGVVALSTGCVYGFVPIASGGARESDPVEPTGAYARSCLGREMAFREAAAGAGARVTLIRLNYSVEMRYGILVDIALNVWKRRPIDLAMGYFNCIWQGDAVAHIIAAMDLADNPPAVLNVTGPETLSVRETAHAFGKRFGRAPVFNGVERETAWLSNAGLAISRFGAPLVTPEEMTPWIANWIESGGSMLGKPTRYEVRDGTY